ncbi:unnamed protein product [Cylicocyclus nassatus]|uniref:Uncharacterized protein n=1 Tax=Cylicocyclus nassatus TaxID=53992 RepID=A0AA36M8N2_CYLNA|nr:unnamed protein product [Cylicocyclus nassatus]
MPASSRSNALANLDPSQFSEEVRALIEKARKPRVNPCPRGKRIIHPDQARGLHLNDSQLSSHSIDTTLSTTANESTFAPPRPVKPQPSNDGLTERERRRRKLIERQNLYNRQEMALGGHHDIFNDPCPEFKPRKVSGEDSIASTDDESQLEDNHPPPAASESQLLINNDEEHVARSSQGRIGQGCSTPQCMANNTLAPLRAIDVSAVTPYDEPSAENTPQVAQVLPKSKNEKPAEAVDEEMVVDEAPTPLAAPNEGDSMEDVLSMMRATPKRATMTRRTTLTASLLHMVDDAPRREDSHSAAEEVQNATYSVHKDGTYTIPNADASNNQHAEVSAPANATFTVSPRQVPLSEKTEVAARPKEQKQAQDEVSFAVPAIPKRRSKNASKTTLQEREERVNTSHKKNMSLLEAMDVDVPSPGRALFAARPLKKPRTLAKTPVRPKQQENDDTMEVSIVMSDISEQPSVTSDDSSAVDLNSDPRPAQQQTPTRAPVQHTPTRTTGVKVTKGTLGHTPRVPRNTFSSLAHNEQNVTSSSSYAGLSADARMEIIKNSVERLSKPKQFTGGVCRRANSGRSTPASPFSQSVDEVTSIEPVTPFEPIDPSRMVVPDAAKSGTVRRVPKPRNIRNMSSKALFAEEETPKNLRANLLKRAGDYKKPRSDGDSLMRVSEPQAQPAVTESAVQCPSGGDSNASSVTATSVNNESLVVPPPPPNTAADASCLSPPQASIEECAVPVASNILSPADEMLAVAARSLSLEDSSPNGDGQGNANVNDAHLQVQSQKLLADSLCTLSTPHRAVNEHSKRRLTVDSMDDDVFVPTDSIPSGSSVEVGNDTIEVRVSSRAGRRNRKKDTEVMILKPRKVVHPQPPTTPNVRRSTRNRIKPVRQWLGEEPVYARSPGGSKTLVGVNEVEVKDKRWVKARTADIFLAQEREMRWREAQRRRREERKKEAQKRKLVRIQHLKSLHARGENLETTVDSIVTSSDEDDENDDIEAIVHVR